MNQNGIVAAVILGIAGGTGIEDGIGIEIEVATNNITGSVFESMIATDATGMTIEIETITVTSVDNALKQSDERR